MCTFYTTKKHNFPLLMSWLSHSNHVSKHHITYFDFLFFWNFRIFLFISKKKKTHKVRKKKHKNTIIPPTRLSVPSSQGSWFQTVPLLRYSSSTSRTDRSQFLQKQKKIKISQVFSLAFNRFTKWVFFFVWFFSRWI